MTRDAELLDQTKGGQQFRFGEDYFREDLFVEEIETPGAKIDQVDQENSDRDEENGHDADEPFEQALEHAETEAGGTGNVNPETWPSLLRHRASKLRRQIGVVDSTRRAALRGPGRITRRCTTGIPHVRHTFS